MLAYPFEEKRLAKWSPPFVVQPKLDGVRCRAVLEDDGEVRLYSSEENEILSVPHINDELKRIDMPRELDGELYVHGWDFQSIVSVTGRTAYLHPDFEKMQYHIFDHVSDMPQAQRIVELGVVKEHTWNSSAIQVVKTALANNLDDVMRIYDDLVGMDYEGIIVRNFEAPYVRKRSIYMMKFKPKKEDIYTVVGYKEEISKDGEPKGRLGALICKSDDGDEFSVGTGLNDAQRIGLWNAKELLPGCLCRVQYQHLTSGKQVPRFPVFVEVVSPYD